MNGVFYGDISSADGEDFFFSEEGCVACSAVTDAAACLAETFFSVDSELAVGGAGGEYYDFCEVGIFVGGDFDESVIAFSEGGYFGVVFDFGDRDSCAEDAFSIYRV